MNGLDFIFIIILGFTAIRGFARGLLKEFFSIFGIVLGLAVASYLFQPAAVYLKPFIDDQARAAVVAYFLVFFSTLGATILIGLGLQSLFESSMLSSMGRLGGVVLGLVKGGIVCSLVLLIFTNALSPKAELITESRLRPYVRDFSQSVASFIPNEFKETVEEKKEAVEKTWEDSVLKKLKELE